MYTVPGFVTVRCNEDLIFSKQIRHCVNFECCTCCGGTGLVECVDDDGCGDVDEVDNRIVGDEEGGGSNCAKYHV